MFACCAAWVGMNRTDAGRGWLGMLLVALQFLLLGLLAWSAAAALSRAGLALDAPVLAGTALILGLWALTANRPGNFNIRPAPRAGGELVRHGPYRWIRHPMYTSLMLAGAAAARLAGDDRTSFAFAGLVTVLFVKSCIEERGLVARYPEYQDYRRSTWRFCPWFI